jgi:hypothetical protein
MSRASRARLKAVLTRKQDAENILTLRLLTGSWLDFWREK